MGLRELFRAAEGEPLIDITDIAFALGLILVAFGVGGFGWQYGVIIAGVLILLICKPFWTWIK